MKLASRKRDAEKQAAQAELDETRKALARQQEELASRLRGLEEKEKRRTRESAAQAEIDARKVRLLVVPSNDRCCSSH